MHYDAMPLNIGTFPRVEENRVVFDGIKPIISLETMKELQRQGTASFQKYISEKCKWVSEIKEFDITDASGSFYVNAYSKYDTADGISEDVKNELSTVISSLEVCTNCIEENKQEECNFTSLTEPYNSCRDLHDSGEDLCCLSFKVIHVSSDQASAQH